MFCKGENNVAIKLFNWENKFYGNIILNICFDIHVYINCVK